MVSSIVPFVVAVASALAMALAFPKTNAVLLAPLGAIGVFWAWFGVSAKRAFWIGWLAGAAYFAFAFAWFGETAGALVAPFGFLLVLVPATLEALLGFAFAGALVAGLARAATGTRAFAPLAGAAVVAFVEWFRAEGIGAFGLPFASLGYSQVDTPLGAVAPYLGTFGTSFATFALGAYGAAALRRWPGAKRGLAAVGCAVAICWLVRPARTYEPPTLRVAAIQGDIAQSIKFAPGTLARSIDRYERLTLAAAAARPRLVVWPETVITTGLNTAPALRDRFAALARRVDATLVVGTLEVEPDAYYNVLDVFGPDGFQTTYRKRRLVPFAERLPFASVLGRLPWAAQVSRFGAGSDAGLFGVRGLRLAPVICWESAFGDLTRNDVSAGAGALVIATDDAWFGTTAGPYMHAQIARMRALETGRWVVRAASTGVSSIVAPDGRQIAASAVGVRAIVAGAIGAPVDTPFDALGDGAVAFGLAAVAIACAVAGRRRA